MQPDQRTHFTDQYDPTSIQQSLDKLETLPLDREFDREIGALVGAIGTHDEAARFKEIALKRIREADSITVTSPLSDEPQMREVETRYPELRSKISSVVRVFGTIAHRFPELIDDELVAAMGNIFKKIHHKMAAGSFDQLHDLARDVGYVFVHQPSLAIKHNIAGEWQRRVETSDDPAEKQLLAQHFLTIFKGVDGNPVSDAVKATVMLRPEFINYVREYSISPGKMCADAAQINGAPDGNGEVWDVSSREAELGKAKTLANRFRAELLE